MNSDLLTDIDFLDFFETFKASNADLSVATTPYYVDIPYAVLEMDEDNWIKGLKEKPKFTYYSNAGIYLVKKEVLNLVPFNQFYNATDLIEDIIKNCGHVNSFPILNYWLDIGKMPDYSANATADSQPHDSHFPGHPSSFDLYIERRCSGSGITDHGGSNHTQKA